MFSFKVQKQSYQQGFVGNLCLSCALAWGLILITILCK
ncbi:hypothetical protein PPAR_a3316 [Pseudoalteromonas paragorgicola KMM 3548]|nr:hypothetical protein [Pseudoalteromonas distincta KMM 3548]